MPVEVKNLFQVQESLNQCWTVLKCLSGSGLGSRNENQLTPLHVRIKLKIDFRFSASMSTWEMMIESVTVIGEDW